MGDCSDIAPGLVSASSDHYEAIYDPDIDVLLDWRSFVDNQMANGLTLANLSDLDAGLES